MFEWLDWGDVPFLITTVVFLGLALFLMFLDAGSRLNQAFALFLVVRGVHNAVFTAQGVIIPPDPTDFATRVNGYFEIAAGSATFYFLYVYLRHYGRVAHRPWIPLTLLGVTMLFLVVYAIDPNLRADPAGNAGPLLVFMGVKILSYAMTAWILGLEYTRTSSSSRRQALYLVSLGFTFDPLWVLVSALVRPVAAIDLWYTATSVVFFAAFVPLGLLAWTMIYRAIRKVGPLRIEAIRFLLIMSLPVVAASAALAVGLLGLPSGPLLQLFGGIWPLALGVLTVAAILRHQLFGLDVKLKITFKGGALFAFFLFLFFVLSEGTQSLIADRTGSTLVGIIGAGLVVAVLAPLHRFADRLANAAMPGVKPIGDMDLDERSELFREWVRLAWSDGSMNRKERRMLDLARERFGLDPRLAARLEKQALDD